jgi:hypothetical protein
VRCTTDARRLDAWTLESDVASQPNCGVVDRGQGSRLVSIKLILFAYLVRAGCLFAACLVETLW